MAFVSRLAPIVPLDQHSFLLRAGETLFLGTLHGDILSASAVQLSPIRDPLPPELDAAIPFVPAQQVGALPVSPPARGGQEEGDLAAPFNAEFRHSVVLCQSPAEVMTLSMLLDSFILSIDPNATLSILAEVRCPGCHVEGPSDVHYFAMEHLLEVEEDAHVQVSGRTPSLPAPPPPCSSSLSSGMFYCSDALSVRRGLHAVPTV